MTALPLLLFLAAHPAASAPAAPAIHRWADGLTLVVQPVPGATTSSLRMVIRAGGALDPFHKAGLAHLLEHLLVEQGDTGRALLRDVRGAGGVLNAHTSHGWTMFELDAAAAPFAGLAERYLKLVTGPSWDDMNLLRSASVVDRESDFRQDERSMLDDALFPAPIQGGPLIGSESSRENVRLSDAQDFFRTHYVPERTTIVVTGAMTLEDAVALVDRGYLIPPVAPPPPPAADVLNVPIEQNVPSFLTATVQGYVLDPRDREVCDELAELVQLRLVLAVREGGPRISDVSTACARLRGYDLLFAFAYTSTLDAPELPRDVDEVFRSVQQGPTADERARLERRRQRERERMDASPEQLADALARQVSEVGAERLGEAVPGPIHPARRLQEAAARSLQPARRFQLNFALRD